MVEVYKWAVFVYRIVDYGKNDFSRSTTFTAIPLLFPFWVIFPKLPKSDPDTSGRFCDAPYNKRPTLVAYAGVMISSGGGLCGGVRLAGVRAGVWRSWHN
jgi:hypothetical protein